MEDGGALHRGQNEYLDEIAPHATGAAYVNYLFDEPARVPAAYHPDTWERLRSSSAHGTRTIVSPLTRASQPPTRTWPSRSAFKCGYANPQRQTTPRLLFVAKHDVVAERSSVRNARQPSTIVPLVDPRRRPRSPSRASSGAQNEGSHGR